MVGIDVENEYMLSRNATQVMTVKGCSSVRKERGRGLGRRMWLAGYRRRFA
jgi:hypothetical protein